MFFSLCDLVLEHFSKQPSTLAYQWMDQKKNPQITYGEFSQKAFAIARTLQSGHLQQQPVLLLYSNGIEFLTAFWGCLFSSVVPIVLPFEHFNRNWDFIHSVYQQAQAKAILTVSQNLSEESTKETFSRYRQKGAQIICTNEIDLGQANLWNIPRIEPNDTVFIQYSSGSTAQPKGVIVTHANLLKQQQLIQEHFNHDKHTIFGSFVPHYHDLGLVGMLIHPFYLGVPCFFMAPDLFVRKPYLWLEMISQFKITTSGAPNFAYQYLVNQPIPAGFQADLSSWKIAFNVADMVFYKTLKAFAQKFAPYQFDFSAFFSGYGMAETTLMVAFTPWKDRKVSFVFCDIASLANNKIQIASEGEDGTTSFVSCGPPVREHIIKIVDPETFQECASEEIAEVWIKGPCVTKGYLNEEVKTQETYCAQIKGDEKHFWLRTGDLGFFHQGNLYIAGRLKDTLIINGQKYYPYELEEEIRQVFHHDSLRTSCLIQLLDYHESIEKIFLIQEIKTPQNKDFHSLNQGIESLLYKRLKSRIHGIYWVSASTLPKTTSGKLKRSLIKQMFREQTFQFVSIYESKKNSAP